MYLGIVNGVLYMCSPTLWIKNLINKMQQVLMTLIFIITDFRYFLSTHVTLRNSTLKTVKSSLSNLACYVGW